MYTFIKDLTTELKTPTGNQRIKGIKPRREVLLKPRFIEKMRGVELSTQKYQTLLNKRELIFKNPA